MEISQVWDFGRTNEDVRLFTDRVGNAEWQPQTGNVLINFGYIIYENGLRPSPVAPGATSFRFREVTHDPVPEVVFDIAFFDYSNTNSTYKGYYAYRCHRIPDLYSTLPEPVADLRVVHVDGARRLEFSGNPHRTYVVEASSDLTHWEEIGNAMSEEGGEGDYDFEPPGFGEGTESYYRVETR